LKPFDGGVRTEEEEEEMVHSKQLEIKDMNETDD